PVDQLQRACPGARERTRVSTERRQCLLNVEGTTIRETRTMPSIKTASILCNIGDDNKEKPGAFNVLLFHEGNIIYECDDWGLSEDWENDTTHSTTSGNVGHRNEPAFGSYVLKVMIDSGDNIDVNANWSIQVVTDDGETLVSDPYQYKFENDVREFQTTYSF